MTRLRRITWRFWLVLAAIVGGSVVVAAALFVGWLLGTPMP